LEFNEKLQALRKDRGLTQDELAQALFVSRTAISKWESGRGYPSIDSLKEISKYFGISIDDLLSGEELIVIAEKENKTNLKSMCDLLLGFVDVFAFMLMILPLYPKKSDGFVFSVNLFEYTDNNAWIISVYWAIFIGLILVGIVKLIMVSLKLEKGVKPAGLISMGLSVLGVLFLAVAKEPYALVLMFILLLAKAGLVYKRM